MNFPGRSVDHAASTLLREEMYAIAHELGGWLKTV